MIAAPSQSKFRNPELLAEKKKKKEVLKTKAMEKVCFKKYLFLLTIDFLFFL